MDIYELPLIKNCIVKAEEFEKAGDTVNANIWLEWATKCEKYYAKQDYKTAWNYYKDKEQNS